MQEPALTETGVVLAPRPIPDPIPLDEPAAPWVWLLLTAAAIAVIGLVVRRGLSRRTSSLEPAVTLAPPEPGPTPEIVDTSCVEGAAHQVRIWLAQRMDETWLARTTESILEDRDLQDGLDAATRGTLGDLLVEADGVKFSPGGSARAARWTPEQLAAQLERLRSTLGPVAPSGSQASSTTPET